MGNEIIDNIVNAAGVEYTNTKRQKLRGQLGAGISENIDPCFIAHKHIVSLKEEPVDLDSFLSLDPDIVCTQGFYQIIYIPSTDKRYVPGKHYIICQDIIRMRPTVSGPRHFHALCDRIPALKWIERNSTFTDDLFAIAKMHPGIGFIFTVKWVEYAAMIERKAKEQGLKLDHGPFLTYKCSKEIEEKYADKKLAPIKHMEDFTEELKAAENDYRAIKEREKIAEAERKEKEKETRN